MKFVSISDVHIKNSDNCPNYHLFLKFLSSKEVHESESVFLLGDIFDIMVGNHKQYIEEYSEIFNNLIKLSKAGKEIIYIEGNHDFHIVELLSSFAKENQLANFYACQKPIVKRDESANKSIYLGHGDEIEIDNWGYRLYTFVIRSWVLKLIVNFLFTYDFIISLGKKASSKSRSRNEKKYSQSFDTEGIKHKFRKCASLLNDNNKYDLIICGHSHVKDMHEQTNHIYINNGYFPLEKSFISYKEGNPELVVIS